MGLLSHGDRGHSVADKVAVSTAKACFKVSKLTHETLLSSGLQLSAVCPPASAINLINSPIQSLRSVLRLRDELGAPSPKHCIPSLFPHMMGGNRLAPLQPWYGPLIWAVLGGSILSRYIRIPRSRAHRAHGFNFRHIQGV